MFSMWNFTTCSSPTCEAECHLTPPATGNMQANTTQQKEKKENSVYTKPSVVFHNANMLTLGLYWAQLCWYDLSRCVHTYACPLGLPYTTSQSSCVSLHEHQTYLDSLCNLNELVRTCIYPHFSTITFLTQTTPLDHTTLCIQVGIQLQPC